jgi:hypothetical protein
MTPNAEPVVWVNMGLSLLRSGLLLLLSLGVIAVTQAQQDAILQFAAVLLPFVDYAASHFLRSRVTPLQAAPVPTISQ